MKKFFLLPWILFTVPFTYAQTGYFPLADSQKTWNVQHYAYPDLYATETLQTFGDTLINDTLRYGVYSTMEEIPENWTLIGFLREDPDRSVYYSYIVSPDPLQLSEEHLIYDFSVEEGDTIEVFNFSFAQVPVTIVIEDSDSIMVNNEMRRRLRYDHLENPMQGETYWIEGLGSNEGLLSTGNYYVVMDIGTWLNCVKQNDTLIYMNPIVEACYISSVGIKEEKGSACFDVLPNPTSGPVTVISSDQKVLRYRFDLYNSAGRKLLELQSHQGESISFDLNNYDLKAGIYFYRITTAKSFLSGKIIFLE